MCIWRLRFLINLSKSTGFFFWRRGTTLIQSWLKQHWLGYSFAQEIHWWRFQYQKSSRKVFSYTLFGRNKRCAYIFFTKKLYFKLVGLQKQKGYEKTGEAKFSWGNRHVDVIVSAVIAFASGAPIKIWNFISCYYYTTVLLQCVRR